MLSPMVDFRMFHAVSIALLLFAFGDTGAQENLNPINPVPGAKTWRWAENGISVRLTQIIPEQVRGFYLGRGFDPNDAELIANDCIFQTVIRNDSAAATVRMDMKRWRVVSGTDSHRPKLREDWDGIWQERDAPAAARLAFRWAFFPGVQVYHRGDWNMGMSSYDLRPGDRFDLKFSFTVGEKIQHGEIKGIECAEDRIPQ